MANFLLMFVITAVFMTTVFPLVVLKQAASIEPEAIAIAYGFVFFHGFVKAYVEEIVFRYAIPFALNLKGSLEIYGALISSVLFGIFHMSVAFLSNNPYPVWMMFYLSLLGMVFYFIYKKSGIMGSTGAHFAYNLGVLGVLPALIGGVA
jgi:membrane protease YdiL (CAAX protease family)